MRQPADDPPVALRCNAPQRAPRFHDTPWGRPRRALGWSLREMAERTGVGAPDLSRIDSGRAAPTPDQARAILHAFDEADE
jgi:predicted transcriptional regulator